MYAIIEDSGQQFRVTEGDVLDVDLRDLPEDAKQLQFDRVLMVGDEGDIRIGTPLLEGAKVLADIVDPQFKGEKVHIYYFRRRKHSRSKSGHRQQYVRVKIAKIVA